MIEHRALVIGKGATLLDALAALLMSLPGFTVVEQASSSEIAVEILKKGPPALVLLDASSFKDDAALDVLRQIRAACPRVQCAVLADGAQDWTRAVAPDAVIWLGTPAAELRSYIGGLLLDQTGCSSADRA